MASYHNFFKLRLGIVMRCIEGSGFDQNPFSIFAAQRVAQHFY